MLALTRVRLHGARHKRATGEPYCMPAANRIAACLSQLRPVESMRPSPVSPRLLPTPIRLASRPMNPGSARARGVIHARTPQPVPGRRRCTWSPVRTVPHACVYVLEAKDDIRRLMAAYVHGRDFASSIGDYFTDNAVWDGVDEQVRRHWPHLADILAPRVGRDAIVNRFAGPLPP